MPASNGWVAMATLSLGKGKRATSENGMILGIDAVQDEKVMDVVMGQSYKKKQKRCQVT